MIVERLVFHTKFGQGDEVTAAFTEWRDKHAPRLGLRTRVLVDVTGPMFTVVAESEYRDFAHVAQVQADLEKEFANPEFQQWFQRWSELTETGSREFYRVVDCPRFRPAIMAGLTFCSVRAQTGSASVQSLRGHTQRSDERRWVS